MDRYLAGRRGQEGSGVVKWVCPKWKREAGSVYTGAVKGFLWLALFDMSRITNEYFPPFFFCILSLSLNLLILYVSFPCCVCVCVSDLLIAHSHTHTPIPHILPSSSRKGSKCRHQCLLKHFQRGWNVFEKDWWGRHVGRLFPSGFSRP